MGRIAGATLALALVSAPAWAGAGELAPDPLNADRLRLNRLLHQTPDLP
jgi:hypothetical protein